MYFVVVDVVLSRIRQYFGIVEAVAVAFEEVVVAAEVDPALY